MKNEFKDCLELLNACISTLNCGCVVSPDEDLYAESIYYRCKQYLRVFEDRKSWESKNRRKEA